MERLLLLKREDHERNEKLNFLGNSSEGKVVQGREDGSFQLSSVF